MATCNRLQILISRICMHFSPNVCRPFMKSSSFPKIFNRMLVDLLLQCLHSGNAEAGEALLIVDLYARSS